MEKLRTWQEIEKLFANTLIAQYPDLKFTTSSNMYKITLPIMEEVQRIEERMSSYLDRNNYLKAEGADLDLYLNDKQFPRRKESKSKGFWVTADSIPGTSALKGEIKFEDEKGNTFANTESFVVDSAGYAIIAIESENYGDSNNLEEKCVNKIKTPVYGLKSGTNLTPTKGGADAESDVEYRYRWERTRNSDSYWNTDGIYTEINSVNGVKSCRVLENDTDFTNVGVGGMDMPSRSRRYYVDGGADSDIAEAIFKKTDRAILETGNVSVEIRDIQGDLRGVKFSRPSYVSVGYKIVLDGYMSTNEAKKIIDEYITNSKINQNLTSFNVVETLRYSIDSSEVINLEVHFSRDNINYFSSLKMEVFEKAVI
ncbi:MAG: baseplate J/gp47 family protein [Fusobacteriaceae bacterium]